MHSDSDRVTAGYQSGSPRQRLVSSLLSAAIIVLALLVAIYQTEVAPRLETQKNPLTFDVTGNNQDAGSKAKAKAKQEKKSTSRTPDRKTVGQGNSVALSENTV